LRGEAEEILIKNSKISIKSGFTNMWVIYIERIIGLSPSEVLNLFGILGELRGKIIDSQQTFE
jgi:hypothetical protein